MPTFQRRPLDQTKPETYDGSTPSTIPTTADQRTQHTNANDAFDAAYDDVAALETGKLDAAHEGAGGAVHALVIPAGAAGFMSGADKARLDGIQDITDHGALSGLADDDHTQYHNNTRGDARYYPRTEADSIFLKDVAGDAAPVLGGELQTKGNHVRITRASDVEVGRLVDLDTFNGAAFLYAPDGVYDPEDGAFVVAAGQAQIGGTLVEIGTLGHTDPGGQQVYVAPSGALYSVAPPAPGWSDSDTSTTDADLGSGTTPGPWVSSGLTMTVAQDVQSGDRLDISAFLYTVNKSASQSGTMDIGFGIDAAQPAAAASNHAIAADFAGIVASSFFTTTAALTAGQTITVYARRNSGTNPGFGLDLVGTTQQHEGNISVPGEGGSGSTTFLGLSDTPGSYAGEDGRMLFVSGNALVFGDPPAGTGDVTSPGTNDGELQQGSAVAKGIANSGILTANVVTAAAAAGASNRLMVSGGADKTLVDSGVAMTDVARLSQANTYTQRQIISTTGDGSPLIIEDADDLTTGLWIRRTGSGDVAFLGWNDTLNRLNVGISCTDPNSYVSFNAFNSVEIGQAYADGWCFPSAAGVTGGRIGTNGAINAKGLYREGVHALMPDASDVLSVGYKRHAVSKAATFTLDFAEADMVIVTANATINRPAQTADQRGCVTLRVAAGVTLTLGANVVQVGSPASSGEQWASAAMDADGTNLVIFWAGEIA